MTELNSGRAYFEKDTFARALGFELVAVEPGSARVRFRTAPAQRNGLGTTHGGVLFALADVAFAVACNSHGQTAIGVQANISYLAAAGDEVLEARATELSRGRKLATYDVRIVADERLVAVFQGTAYLR